MIANEDGNVHNRRNVANYSQQRGPSGDEENFREHIRNINSPNTPSSFGVPMENNAPVGYDRGFWINTPTNAHQSYMWSPAMHTSSQLDSVKWRLFDYTKGLPMSDRKLSKYEKMFLLAVVFLLGSLPFFIVYFSSSTSNSNAAKTHYRAPGDDSDSGGIALEAKDKIISSHLALYLSFKNISTYDTVEAFRADAYRCRHVAEMEQETNEFHLYSNTTHKVIVGLHVLRTMMIKQLESNRDKTKFVCASMVIDKVFDSVTEVRPPCMCVVDISDRVVIGSGTQENDKKLAVNQNYIVTVLEDHSLYASILNGEHIKKSSLDKALLEEEKRISWDKLKHVMTIINPHVLQTSKDQAIIKDKFPLIKDLETPEPHNIPRHMVIKYDRYYPHLHDMFGLGDMKEPRGRISYMSGPIVRRFTMALFMINDYDMT